MTLSFCCVLALLSRAQAQGPGQDMVEIDFEPLGPNDGEMVMLGGPGPAKKGKSPGGLSEKELDDVLSDMLGPANVPQKSGPHDVPGNGPPSLPTDLSRIPNDAEVVMGNGQNGLPEGTVVEIDGPTPNSEADMDELMAALEGRPPNGGRPPSGGRPQNVGKPEKGGPGNSPPGDEIIMGNGHNGLPPGVAVEVVADDQPPPGMVMMQDGPGPMGGPGDIPPEILKQLFPPGQVVIEEDDGPGPQAGGRPPPGADAVIKDLMQEMDEALVDQVMPLAEQAAENNLPGSCSKEIKAHCRDAKSQLHCLGKYPNDISDKCRADVGHAVPFLCSDAIDHYCDVLMGGILSCLGNQLDNLQGPCKDAVIATKKVIQKVNSQKKAAPPAPKAKASLSAREANLDAKLIGLSTPSHAKAKPPAVVPHLQEKLLDHDMRMTHGKKPEQSQSSPPFMAWFVPLLILLFGALVVQRSSSVAANTRQYSAVFASSKSEETFKPLRTKSGMEMLTPGTRFDLDI